MKLLSDADLARMRAAQAETYFDTCRICSYSEGAANGWGHRTSAWPLSDAIACGFDPGGAREVLGEAQIAMRPATLRLPLDTDVQAHDRIQITHRHGSALSEPVYYAIIGTPERGPSGLVLKLELVPDPEVD